jgi:Ca2+-binding EF-hand superfamily protein
MSRRFKSYKQNHKDNINNTDSEKIESIEIITTTENIKEISEFKNESPKAIKNKTVKSIRNHRIITEENNSENNQIKLNNLNNSLNNNNSFISNEKKNPNNLNRPLLTLDEINQIKKDFNLLDITKSGFLKPNLILVFMEKNKNFQNLNPFYFNALKNLNTEENNKNGIKVDQFIKEIKKVIRENVEENFEKNWIEKFNLFFNDKENNDNNNRVLNKEYLEKILNKNGFNLSEDEINLIIKEYGEINQNKFIEIMKNVELKNRK